MNGGRIYLHIGCPKTATTTLQQCFFNAHPDIYLLGKQRGAQATRRCCSQDAYRFLYPLLWDSKQPFDIDNHRKLLKERILPQAGAHKRLLCSWESLIYDPVHKHEIRLNRLQSLFNTCRIIVTIRNPLVQLPSLYLQHIRGNFLLQNRPWMGNSAFVDFGQWLKLVKTTLGGSYNLCCYTSNIEVSLNHLGKENVGVFMFEELLDNPSQYYGRICQFLGVDSKHIPSTITQKHLNKRITEGQIRFLQEQQASPWRRFVAGALGHRYRKQLFVRNGRDRIPARITLSPEWAQEISDTTRTGNRWLAETFGLPLEKHGYPL